MNAETWGELGSSMRALNERQRAFVRFFLMERPGYGAAVAAYRKAGYGKTSKPTTQSKDAYHLLRTEKVIAAISEEARKVLRGIGHAEAVSALLNMIRNPKHRDHARAVDMILRRADPEISKIDVTHRVIDPDQEALEELRALRKLDTNRDKLLELYGPNGLDRLEMLEAADNARRAGQAKLIEGRAIEHDEATDGR